MMLSGWGWPMPIAFWAAAESVIAAAGAGAGGAGAEDGLRSSGLLVRALIAFMELLV